MLWPNSSTSNSAVSWSIVWLIVTTISILNSAFTRSAPFSAMRLASSCTVIASGTITSRTCFSRGCDWPAKCARRLLLARTLERGERAGAGALVVVERAVDGELAAVAAIVDLRPAHGCGFFSSRFFSGFLMLGTRDRA